MSNAPNAQLGAQEKGAVLPSGPSKPEMMEAVASLLSFLKDKPLDQKLEVELNERFGATSEVYSNLLRLLRAGIEEGWACYAQIDGPDYCRGQLAKATENPNGYSVESGMLKNVLGNFHLHPRGEINMIGPVDEGATFCGSGAGWKVFEPGSRHFPTVNGGKVTMLFFLPGGEIEYMDPCCD
uniref:2-hydroxylaminobenzoate mutase n=1 Tax=Pseudomonas fluorescens TaxID=294 RepID=A4UVY2_PSEFL|nr:2-hydroxylaminobenzoate mutase [Pseudomonas fluorescens]